MNIRFVGPSATKMMLDASFELPSRCRSLLLLAACLLAATATVRSQPCRCENHVHTVRCVGCTHLPNNLPAGVSRLNVTANRVTRIQFATNVSPALADLTSIYLRDNAIQYIGSGDLRPLERLMVLDLSYNRLVYVDEQFISSNRHLKRLILDGNQHLQLVALHSQSLELLYMRNCGLTSFDKRLLRRLPKLRVLNLERNDQLPCARVIHDLQQDWPQLKVYCDTKTTAGKSVTAATTASISTENPNPRAPAHIPNFVHWDVPSGGFPSETPESDPQWVIVPILIIPLVVGLVVLLAAVLYRCCRARPGRSGHGRLHEEPC